MTPRLTGPRRGGRSFLVSVACHSARSFSFKALLSRPHSASTAPELRRQLRRVRAERDQLREELLNLEALYCRMVESRSLLFFEKEVRARARVCVCVHATALHPDERRSRRARIPRHLWCPHQHLTMELETLTQDLFEEANRMVAQEARLRSELQSSNARLSADLERVIKALEEDLTHHRDRVSPSGYDKDLLARPLVMAMASRIAAPLLYSGARWVACWPRATGGCRRSPRPWRRPGAR